MVRTSERESSDHKGLCLPAIYRKAAERAYDRSEPAHWAIFMADESACPHRYSPAETLWNSFAENNVVEGDEAVLGLLLLAEILETAQ